MLSGLHIQSLMKHSNSRIRNILIDESSTILDKWRYEGQALLDYFKSDNTFPFFALIFTSFGGMIITYIHSLVLIYIIDFVVRSEYIAHSIPKLHTLIKLYDRDKIKLIRHLIWDYVLPQPHSAILGSHDTLLCALIKSTP